MKKYKWHIIGIVSAIVIIMIVISFLEGTPVKTSTVIEGSINEFVEERAKTTLSETIKITMPLDGQIAPLLLKAGTPVKKDQEVAKMITFDLEKSCKEAEANCEMLTERIKINEYNAMEKTALKESTGWIKTMNELVKISEQRIKASQKAAEYADEYKNSMIKSGEAVSKLNVSKAKMEASVAKVNVESNKLINNTMIISESMVKLAPTYINQYLNRKSLDKKILGSELSAAEAKLSQIQNDLKRAKMVSSVDGVVLKRYYSNQRVLPAGELLMELGDISKLQITADILSQDVVNIKPGDRVEISGPAIGTESVKGKVNRVDPKGFTKISSLGVEQQRVKVVIDFNRDDFNKLISSGRSFGVDYRVQVKIITCYKPKALIIPRTALFKDDSGQWQVFKKEMGWAELTKVQVGLINDKKAEIIKGLKKGDTIVSCPPASLSNGSRISSKN
jgi:HlyD family secretion protein